MYASVTGTAVNQARDTYVNIQLSHQPIYQVLTRNLKCNQVTTSKCNAGTTKKAEVSGHKIRSAQITYTLH